MFVRHGNQLLRIAPNRLIKRFQDQHTIDGEKDKQETAKNDQFSSETATIEVELKEKILQMKTSLITKKRNLMCKKKLNWKCQCQEDLSDL